MLQELTKTATRGSDGKTIPLLLTLSKKPDSKNPDGVSDYELICKLTGCDVATNPGGTEIFNSMLEIVGAGDLIEEQERKSKNTERIVVGKKLENSPEIVEALLAVTEDVRGESDWEPNTSGAGSAMFKYLLAKVIKIKGEEVGISA